MHQVSRICRGHRLRVGAVVAAATIAGTVGIVGMSTSSGGRHGPLPSVRTASAAQNHPNSTPGSTGSTLGHTSHPVVPPTVTPTTTRPSQATPSIPKAPAPVPVKVPTPSPVSVPPTTLVVTPRAATAIPVYDEIYGPQVNSLSSTTDGGPTWVPVLQQRHGWDQIQLPGPPNDLVGWVPSSSVSVASDSYAVQVSLSARVARVYQDGHLIDQFPAAVGKPSTPTPAGRTFIAGDVMATGVNAIEAPLLRPLGWHTTSALAAAEFPALHTGGQAGVIAIHGWEGEDVNPALWSDGHGMAVSHGCIRLPAAAMTGIFSQLPTGTPVIISQ